MMKRWKSILFPPTWVMLALAVMSTVALIAVFVNGWEEKPLAYVSYVVSFYCLTVICFACPKYCKSIKYKVCQNRYANRYLTDAVFKTHLSLYLSLSINLLYAAVNALLAVLYGTNWFGIFAVYYAILAVMRFLLVRHVRHCGIGRNRMGELKRSRTCAGILMTVNLALSGAVLMMVYHGRGFEYRGIMIYVMALYTFWVTVTAIVDLVQYRKYHSPVMSTAKAIKLAAALVSMLSLETAMFSQFGGETSPKLQQMMIMATGGGIAVVVTAMSVYMIVRSTKELQKLQQEGEHA